MEKYKIGSLDEMSPQLILALVDKHKQKEVSRIKRLKSFYIGQSDIKKRSMADPSKPNNKIDNPFGAYITDTITGYFTGKPVTYSSNDDLLMAKLQLVYDINQEQTHNSKLSKMLSITGTAYELLYMNEANEIKFSLLDPEEVFMIYDNSIESKPLAAVRFYEVQNYVTDEVVNHIELYTAQQVQYFIQDGSKLKLMNEYTHYFKEVPVIQYFNTDEATGDYEKVMDLINGYNLAVSDTANNLDYFSDSYLVLKGVDIDPGDLAHMKQNRVMLLAENGDAQWLTKGQIDMQIEEYKVRLKDDIFTFSQVPNMADETFGSATSGESLKYKLFSLENAVSIKERNFTQGLEQRIKLIVNMFNIKGSSHHHTDIVMKYTRNLPSNISELSDLVVKLQGVLSDKTLMSLLPFVEDPGFEIELRETEKAGSLYSNLGNE